MRQLIALICALALACSALAKDPFVGEYSGANKGLVSKSWQTVAARVSRVKDSYRVEIIPALVQRVEPYLDIFVDGAVGKDKLEFKGGSGYSGVLEKNGDMKLVREKDGKSEEMLLKRVNRVSPTMGKNPPENAVVLFDGSSTDEWKNIPDDGKPCCWNLLKDEKVLETRLMMDEGGKKRKYTNIGTKRRFGDFTLHIEFKLPEEYGPNQPKYPGNSGVYIGETEIQILDSFAREGVWNDCGAVYRYSPPRVNASLPPETWQTYDIRYKAPRFNEKGEIVSYPLVDVSHNGVIIQRGIVLTRGTSHAQKDFEKLAFKKGDELARIMLQDHNAVIQFRNIWLVEE